jgi:beta-lactamase regulating signal transducer with metallopeptidase domain
MNLPQVWATNAEVQALGWTLLHFVWQGMAVAAVLGLALDSLSQRAASLRYAWCLVSLLVLTACPVVTYCAVRSEIGNSFAVRKAAFHSAAGLPNDLVANLSQLSTSELAQLASDLDNYVPPPPPMSGSRELAWVVIGWMCGALLLSARLMGGWFAAWRVVIKRSKGADPGLAEMAARLAKRIGLPRSIPVATSTWINVPMVVGCLRPIILLPASSLTGLSTAHLEALIVHEMAHLRRHDALVNAIQAFVEIALFYHPAVWWISRQLRNEREAACDDLAAAVIGDRTVYARALATLEASRCAPVALAANDGRLLSRIRRLMGESDMSARSTLPALGVGIVAAALCVGSVQLQASAQGDKTKPVTKKSTKPVSRQGQDLVKYRDGIPMVPKSTGSDGIPVQGVLLDKLPLGEVVANAPSPELYERIEPLLPSRQDDVRKRLEALEDLVRRLMARLESSDRLGRAVPGVPVVQEDIAARRASVEVAQERLDLSRALEQKARAEVDAGVANLQAIQKARVDVAQSEADRLNAMAQLKVAEEQRVRAGRSRAGAEVKARDEAVARLNRDLAARELAVSRDDARSANTDPTVRRDVNIRQSDELQELRKMIEDLRRQNEDLKRQLQQVRPRRSGLSPADPAALPFVSTSRAATLAPTPGIAIVSPNSIGIATDPNLQRSPVPPSPNSVDPAVSVASPAPFATQPARRSRATTIAPQAQPGVAVPSADPVLVTPTVRTGVSRTRSAAPPVILGTEAKIAPAMPAGRVLRVSPNRAVTIAPRESKAPKVEVKPTPDRHPGDPDNWPFNRPE